MPEFREVDIDQILPNPYGELKEHPQSQINQLASAHQGGRIFGTGRP